MATYGYSWRRWSCLLAGLLLLVGHVSASPCHPESDFRRVVGYYDVSHGERFCNNFKPHNVEQSVYSHINVAFAAINPAFQVVPVNVIEANMRWHVSRLKKHDYGGKVFITITDWRTDDVDDITATFSDLIRSPTNQEKFFRSLTYFLTYHDFDGVDIDWKFRGATDEDFAAFPQFMANLKRELAFTGRYGLTMTLPSLQRIIACLDIKALQDTVDFFNVITHDTFGTGNKGDTWTGNGVSAHYNQSETEAVLDLLRHKNVYYWNIVLGMSFDAKGYTLTDPSCADAGCTFSSGSDPGRCSKHVGLLLHSELDAIVAQKGLQPRPLDNGAVKVVSWDDLWFSFDDPETIALKAEYARSRCLGGLMVWAINHDANTGEYSRALERVAPLKSGSRFQSIVKHPTTSPKEPSMAELHQKVLGRPFLEV